MNAFVKNKKFSFRGMQALLKHVGSEFTEYSSLEELNKVYKGYEYESLEDLASAFTVIPVGKRGFIVEGL